MQFNVHVILYASKYPKTCFPVQRGSGFHMAGRTGSISASQSKAKIFWPDFSEEAHGLESEMPEL